VGTGEREREKVTIERKGKSVKELLREKRKGPERKRKKESGKCHR
jgi:hypothetical protein